MGEQETKEQTKKALLAERMRNKYPDMNVDDEEMMSGQIMDDYDNYEKENGAFKEREDKLVGLFTRDPKSAYFMQSWRDGGDPTIEMIRTFGDEFMEAINDPDKQEELAKARKEYVDRVTKSKEMDDESEANLISSMDRLAERVDAGELSEDKVDDAVAKLYEIANNMLMNKITDEDVNLVLKGMGYDEAIKEADHVGEVRGRNAKIDEKLYKSKKGDSVSHLDGKNSIAAKPVENRRPRSVFDIATGAR